MKNLVLLLFLASCLSASPQVAINTDGTSPDNSAMLDVKSTTQGMLLPRMTSAERIAITSPATGLTVYDLTTQSYWYYNGTAWATIANSPWTVNGNNMYANITGKAGIGTTLPDDKLHLYDSVNLRILIETPDNFYAGVRTRNSQREYFMGTIGDRWSVFDNNVGGERISVLPDGNVGIATTTPDPSAALDVSSTTKGFLPPRMTEIQRNGISSPATGLIIYQTDGTAGLYHYNGIAWVAISGIADGSETKLTAGNNVTITGSGTTASPYVVNATGATTLTIGQSYQGGIIFWLDATGQHGLIASTADQSTAIQWYNGTFRSTSTTGDGLYAGAMNTTMIIATQLSDDQTGNFAAKVCADYSVTVGSISYGDWYLPSKYELDLLYQQKDVVGGFASAPYWSSTEFFTNYAWFQRFDSGNGNSLKYSTFYVRAIRSF